jgi:hypothetical protein
MKDVSSAPDSPAARFSAAPLEIKMYAVFAALATILGLGLLAFAPGFVRDSVVPITGWGPGLNYAFTLFFAFALIFAKHIPRKTSIMWRFAIVAILFISIFSGYQAFQRAGVHIYGAPYVKMNPFQPVWTMVIPGFWIMMILSPRVKKYYLSRDENPAS